MSIQEKKSSKGTPFAIVKFSDNSSEFELFLFSELLTTNRDKLKESASFILTLQKDKFLGENTQQRINIRKILNLSEMIRKPYQNVSIELSHDYNIEELKEALKEKGNTKINFIIKDKNKSFAFKLEKTRKFDLTTFNNVKNKQYVKKISF
jgi:DNA polymerase-3 subunit alpha